MKMRSKKCQSWAKVKANRTRSSQINRSPSIERFAPACKFLWTFRNCFNRMTILLFQLLRNKNLPKTSIFQETAFDRLNQWCASLHQLFSQFEGNNLRLRKKNTGMKNIHAGVHIYLSGIIASRMCNAVVQHQTASACISLLLLIVHYCPISVICRTRVRTSFANVLCHRPQEIRCFRVPLSRSLHLRRG